MTQSSCDRDVYLSDYRVRKYSMCVALPSGASLVLNSSLFFKQFEFWCLRNCVGDVRARRGRPICRTYFRLFGRFGIGRLAYVVCVRGRGVTSWWMSPVAHNIDGADARDIMI